MFDYANVDVLKYVGDATDTSPSARSCCNVLVILPDTFSSTVLVPEGSAAVARSLNSILKSILLLASERARIV